jgi:hypothetical protein
MLLPCGITNLWEATRKAREQSRPWGRVPGSNPGGPATPTVPGRGAAILENRIIKSRILAAIHNEWGDVKRLRANVILAMTFVKISN